MLLRSQAAPPSENTRSRSRANKSKAARRDIEALSKPSRARSNRSSRTTSGSGKSKRRTPGPQDDDNLGILDVCAAEAGLDQAHIVDHPEWKLMDMPEELELMDEEMDEVNDSHRAANAQYTQEFAVTLYQLSESNEKWIDLGPGRLTLEANLHSSRAIVHMVQTHRVLAHWAIFGGMKVARFLTTVIVVAIVAQDDDSQKIVSYGLKVDTLERAREVAILFSSTSHGMQTNLERLVPKLTAEERAKILENMTDRLLILQRRLETLHNSQLSAQVESELAGMLAIGANLKQ